MQIEDALKLLPGLHFEATQQDDEENTAQPAAPGGVGQSSYLLGRSVEPPNINPMFRCSKSLEPRLHAL